MSDIELLKRNCEEYDCCDCDFYSSNYGCVLQIVPFMWDVKDINDKIERLKEHVDKLMGER